MTGAERRVWTRLRAHRLQGSQFRRQCPIGPWIADFASHAARLIVELDGDQHGQGDGPIRDGRRDQWFAANGYATLRFSNWQVFNELDSVLLTIEAAVTGTLPFDVYASHPSMAVAPPVGTTPSPALPHQGGGRQNRPDASSVATIGTQHAALPSPSMGEGREGVLATGHRTGPSDA
jgi:very-short-patch-repair endonuclease